MHFDILTAAIGAPVIKHGAPPGHTTTRWVICDKKKSAISLFGWFGVGWKCRRLDARFTRTSTKRRVLFGAPAGRSSQTSTTNIKDCERILIQIEHRLSTHQGE